MGDRDDIKSFTDALEHLVGDIDRLQKTLDTLSRAELLEISRRLAEVSELQSDSHAILLNK